LLNAIHEETEPVDPLKACKPIALPSGMQPLPGISAFTKSVNLLLGDAIGSRDKAAATFCPFTYETKRVLQETLNSPEYAVPEEFSNSPSFERKCENK
jgi:hypothetical protein